MSGYNWTKAQQEAAAKRRAKEDRPATPAQKALLKKLAEETGRTVPPGLTVGEASDWIDSLKRSKKGKTRGTFGKSL